LLFRNDKSIEAIRRFKKQKNFTTDEDDEWIRHASLEGASHHIAPIWFFNIQKSSRFLDFINDSKDYFEKKESIEPRFYRW
jgi:hypothetical protein